MIGLESHCFRLSGRPLLEILAFARLRGFRHLALYTTDAIELPTRAIDALLEEAGLGAMELSVTLPRLSSSEIRSVRDYEQHLNLAETLGASVARLFWLELGARSPVLKSEGLYDTLACVIDMAARRNIQIALENHGDFSVDELSDLAGTVPGLQFCFDVGNQFASGESPIECMRAMEGRIVLAHLKDIGWRFESETSIVWRAVPLGQGGLPLSVIVPELLAFLPRNRLLLEISTSGGLRRATIRDTSGEYGFLSFCRKYQRYDPSFENYVLRGSGSVGELAQQEEAHVAASCSWLSQNGLLPAVPRDAGSPSHSGWNGERSNLA